MSTNKVICHAPGERCLGCDHYHGKADKCKYADATPEPTSHAIEVAWIVSVYEMTCVVFASSRAKAKWTAVKSYWDAYGKSGTWPTCYAIRRVEYDKFPERGKKAYEEEYVRSFL